jgi:hypothetical protein
MDRDTWFKIRNTPRKDPRPLKFFHISRKIVEMPGPGGKPQRGAWSIGSYKRGMTQTDAQKGLEPTSSIPEVELAKYA